MSFFEGFNNTKFLTINYGTVGFANSMTSTEPRKLFKEVTLIISSPNVFWWYVSVCVCVASAIVHVPLD